VTRQELEIPIVVGATASWLALCLAVFGWLPLPVFILIAIGAGLAGAQLVVWQYALVASGSHESVWTHLRRRASARADA
jgi:hypothetical protein